MGTKHTKGPKLTQSQMTFIDEIYDFNLKAGLLDQPYNDFLESSFQIEEALEGFDPNRLRRLYSLLTSLIKPEELPEELEVTPKDVARDIVARVNRSCTGDNSISDVDRLDKAIDALVFAVGSMAKLKLTPEQIARAISVVTQANLQKLSMSKDEFGKLQKPADFVGPETQLLAILDERSL